MVPLLLSSSKQTFRVASGVEDSVGDDVGNDVVEKDSLLFFSAFSVLFFRPLLTPFLSCRTRSSLPPAEASVAVANTSKRIAPMKRFWLIFILVILIEFVVANDEFMFLVILVACDDFRSEFECRIFLVLCTACGCGSGIPQPLLLQNRLCSS